MLINSEGVIIRIRISDISTQGRYATGVKLINLAENVTVVGTAKISDKDIEENIDEDIPDEENITEITE